jgi:hypothetical protein
MMKLIKNLKKKKTGVVLVKRTQRSTKYHWKTALRFYLFVQANEKCMYVIVLWVRV